MKKKKKKHTKRQVAFFTKSNTICNNKMYDYYCSLFKYIPDCAKQFDTSNTSKITTVIVFILIQNMFFAAHEFIPVSSSLWLSFCSLNAASAHADLPFKWVRLFQSELHPVTSLSSELLKL